MSEKKFNSVEECEEHYKNVIVALKEELTAAKKEASDAKEIAKDAVEKANTSLQAGPQAVVVSIAKAKYQVVFGVDGLTKEELSKDLKKCAELVKKGSAALELMED